MNSAKKMIVAAITGIALVGSSTVFSARNVENEPTITAQQAIEIALSAIPGVIFEVELEKEGNEMVWEVELVSSEDDKEYEILIDASTGNVIKQELDEDLGDWGFLSFKDHDRGDH